jgi:hypothetical protein
MACSRSVSSSCPTAQFAVMKATVAKEKLEEINDVLARMHRDEIEGRIVLNLSGTRDPIRWLARQQGENYPKRLEGSITV